MTSPISISPNSLSSASSYEQIPVLSAEWITTKMREQRGRIEQSLMQADIARGLLSAEVARSVGYLKLTKKGDRFLPKTEGSFLSEAEKKAVKTMVDACNALMKEVGCHSDDTPKNLGSWFVMLDSRVRLVSWVNQEVENRFSSHL